MEIRYHPGSDLDFVKYMRTIPYPKKELISIEGKARWLITEEDGTKYILRPQSAQEHAE